MRVSICANCKFDLTLNTAHSIVCDLCGDARLCLLCAASDDTGLAICGPCKTQQEDLSMLESATKRLAPSTTPISHPPCQGCDGTRARWSMLCSFCAKPYCNDCIGIAEKHRCVMCAIEGCDKQADRLDANGLVVAPSMTCCASGPVCGAHRRIHNVTFTMCLAINHQTCKRCNQRLDKWLVCAWGGCTGVITCPNRICSFGYCKHHYAPERLPCGFCGCPLFSHTIADNSVVAGLGTCCNRCFVRVRAFIECIMLRFRGTHKVWPKDLMLLIIKIARP